MSELSGTALAAASDKAEDVVLSVYVSTVVGTKLVEAIPCIVRVVERTVVTVEVEFETRAGVGIASIAE